MAGLTALTGVILIYCGGRKALASPIGWGRFKCSLCGQIIRGVEEQWGSSRGGLFIRLYREA